MGFFVFFPPVFDVIAQKNETFHTFSHFKLAQRTAVLPLWYNKRKKKKTHTTPAQTFHYNTIISHLNRDGAIIKTVRVEQN